MNGSPGAGRYRRRRDRLADLPRWIKCSVGIAAAALGLWLMVWPLSSINLLVLVIALTLISTVSASWCNPQMLIIGSVQLDTLPI